MRPKKEKIIFLDIDGPMIPGRAYTMPNQTKGFVKTFDPCAVGILNTLCQESGWKVVIHSSWLRVFGEQDTFDHCVDQGIRREHFHKDPWCKETINWRYTRIAEWLSRHPEVTHYVILDDEPYAYDLDWEHVVLPPDMEKHLLLIDFDDGILTSIVNKIRGNDWRV